MEKKEEYLEKLGAELKEFSASIDDFAKKAEYVALEHRTKLRREISEFNAIRLEAQIKLRRMEQSSGDVWEALAPGVDRTWAEMKEAVGKIAEKFKQPR